MTALISAKQVYPDALVTSKLPAPSGHHRDGQLLFQMQLVLCKEVKRTKVLRLSSIRS